MTVGWDLEDKVDPMEHAQQGMSAGAELGEPVQADLALPAIPWVQIAMQAGQLAQQYGPQVAQAIQKWWEGSEEQNNIGVVSVHLNEPILVQMGPADYQTDIVLPGAAGTVQLNQPGWVRSIRFSVPGQSALVIQSTNDNGPWQCNVTIRRPNDSVPIVWVNTSGNDNLWVNRRRLYLAKVQVS